jgi:flavorubredoxin
MSVALIYASAYGNTATLAQAIAKGVTKAGVAVESINCEFTEPDEIQAAVENVMDLLSALPRLGAYAHSSANYLGVVLSSAAKGKLAGVFGSYGWSGKQLMKLKPN